MRQVDQCEQDDGRMHRTHLRTGRVEMQPGRCVVKHFPRRCRTATVQGGQVTGPREEQVEHPAASAYQPEPLYAKQECAVEHHRVVFLLPQRHLFRQIHPIAKIPQSLGFRIGLALSITG
jgi:hypothetical protein